MGRKVQISILTSLILVSCAHGPKHYDREILNISQVNQLEAKRALYLELSEKQLDRDTLWIKDTKCDGLLFQSLYATAGGSGDPLLAEGEEGEFFRSPQKDCYALELQGKSGSKSTVSRDMFLGLYHWILSRKLSPVLDRIIRYGKNHRFAITWSMGVGSIFDTTFTPSIIGTTYQMRFHLSGKDSIYRHTRQVWPAKCVGYECHLQVLHIFARWRAGASNSRAIGVLSRISKFYPDNALFNGVYALVTGSKDASNKAYESLMTERWFPKDRLPGSGDRCGFYLWQRTPGSNSWQPCPSEGKTHTGIDFLFASAVLLGKIK